MTERSRYYNPPLAEQLSRSGDPEEESEARRAIEHCVTNPDGSIYALKPFVPELFAALAKARYSRTDLSARQLLWREFFAVKDGINWDEIDQGMNSRDEVFNFTRAEEVAERILLAYGDDSVFELAGAHLFFDRVSQPAAKIIEDARIGLSPIEKSTRYVVFDQKGPDGDYSFYKDPRIMDSPHGPLYLDSTRACFDFYTQSVVSLQDYFRAEIPIENEKFPDLSRGNGLVPFSDLTDERSIRAARTAYNQSVRAKACDVARVLLPASALTNIGEFGNARAFGYLLTKLLASPLAEMQMIGAEATIELKKILPKFFDIVDNERGEAYQKYLQNTESQMEWWANKLFRGKTPLKSDRVELIVGFEHLPEVKIAAGLLYPYTDLPLSQIIGLLGIRSDSTVEDILHDSLKFRTNRRHKPPRAFELAGYELLFDIMGNFGIYRDLQRQRMLTQQRQPYTTDHGFDMPVEFSAVSLDQGFENTMGRMKMAHDAVAVDFPAEAQYLTTLANYMRWYMGMNLREGFWVSELRSIPQGHFSYRTVAQDMFIKAQEIYPFLKYLSSQADTEGQQGQFVNMSDRSRNLERIEAMQRIETKLSQLEDQYS